MKNKYFLTISLGLGCQTSFTLVDDVGCLYISTQAMKFSAAATACPPNSKLYTASFLIDFDAMRNFLLMKLARRYLHNKYNNNAGK
jgi:hypothetical protein